MIEEDFCEVILLVSLHNHTINQYKRDGIHVNSLFFDMMNYVGEDMLLGHPENSNDFETVYALHGEIFNCNFESDEILIYLEKVLTALEKFIPEYNLKRVEISCNISLL